MTYDEKQALKPTAVNGQQQAAQRNLQVSARGRIKKGKRTWTAAEEDKLMEALLEMANSGRHKGENGFKPGFLMVLEKDLEQKLPGCGLKGKPHIESKIKVLKREFNVIYDMLNGSTSGFVYNGSNHCVEADKNVWENYITNHPEAESWRYKKFPHYNNLCIVFGKDRATESNAQDVEDMMIVMAEQDQHIDNVEAEDLDESESEQQLSPSGRVDTGEESHSHMHKRQKTNETELVSAFKDVAKCLIEDMRAVTRELSESLTSKFEKQKEFIGKPMTEVVPTGDKLVLRGLQFYGTHGVNPEEKKLGQKFLVDVDVWLDLRLAGVTDDLTKTVSYTDIYRIVKDTVEGPPHNLLESVAHQIATTTLEKYRQISAISVKVGKPHVAVRGPVDYLGVEILRYNQHV